ncbi:MAG: hypothetical protein ACLGHQ_11595, partial [Acidimicrobiia bacterium]
MSIRRAYGLIGPTSGHPLSMPVVGAAAAVAAIACHQRSLAVAVAAALVAWEATRRSEVSAARALLVLLVVAAGVTWRAGVEQAALVPDRLGPYTGWARIVDDPQPFGGATRVVVEIEDERVETWIRGRARRQRVAGWRGGEHVQLSGTRVPLDDERARRVAWQHVVAELRIDWASDVRAG